MIEGARTVYVPPRSFRETTRKHRSGKWLEVAPIIGRLLRARGGLVAPYTAEMPVRAGNMDWSHRDPFDRMIAATAFELACPLIVRDRATRDLGELPGWPRRIWSTVLS